MKRTIFCFAILALLSVFLTSCAPELEDINGNAIWLENERFVANDNYWSIAEPGVVFVNLRRVPLAGSTDFTGPAIHCVIKLFNWPEGGAPQLGKYSCNTYHPDSLDQAFFCGVSRHEVFNNSHYLTDTTQTNSFEIIKVFGNSFSGKVSCHLHNTEYPNEKKWLKASFENIIYK